MTFIQKLLTWISASNLKVSHLEKESGITGNLLQRAIKHNEGSQMKGAKPLSEKHYWKLASVCARFGLELDGWKVQYDAETDVFLMLKLLDLPQLPQESFEVKHDSGSSFVYYLPAYREVIDNQDELIEFFEGSVSADPQELPGKFASPADMLYDELSMMTQGSHVDEEIEEILQELPDRDAIQSVLKGESLDFPMCRRLAEITSISAPTWAKAQLLYESTQ